MHYYPIYQFLVASELPLPAAPLEDSPFPKTDAPLSVRRLAAPLAFPSDAAPLASIFEGQLRSFSTEDGVVICVEQYLQIHVDRSGNRVSVYAAPGAEQEAALYVVSMGITLCAARRGILCIHGAGVEFEGRRIGILAPSGTGKSSTAWAFMRAGALFANDDVLLIRQEGHAAHTLPSVSLYPKVNADLLAWADLAAHPCPAVLAGSQKYWFPLPLHQRVTQPAPLTHLFVLRPRPATDPDDAVVVERQHGMSAVAELMGHSQAAGLAAQLSGRRADLLPRFGNLLRSVPLSTLSYPKRFDRLPALVDAVRNTVLAPEPGR